MSWKVKGLDLFGFGSQKVASPIPDESFQKALCKEHICSNSEENVGTFILCICNLRRLKTVPRCPHYLVIDNEAFYYCYVI